MYFCESCNKHHSWDRRYCVACKQEVCHIYYPYSSGSPYCENCYKAYCLLARISQ